MHTVIAIVVTLGYFFLIRRLSPYKKVRKIYKKMYNKECREKAKSYNK